MAEALTVAQSCLPLYAHKFAPKKFTQPQLFACLVLKEFEKKDYRGAAQLLTDCRDLRETIGLRHVPHYTTLQKASQRLLKLKHVRSLLRETIHRIHRRRKNVAYAAGDSSGFDARHASRYYVHRRDGDKSNPNRPKKRITYHRHGKMMVIVCCLSHAILGVVASHGPTPDIDQLDTVLAEVPADVHVKHMVLDAGFDSAHNHRLLRVQNGILSTIPPEHGRPAKDPRTLPSDKYRRRMKTHFNHKAYRKRPQVETVFSMLKRNLGVALSGRSPQARRRDLVLRALTHNVSIALLWVFYRAGRKSFYAVGVIWFATPYLFWFATPYLFPFLVCDPLSFLVCDPLSSPATPYLRLKGAGSRSACLAMAFKLVESAQKSWRKLNGSPLLPEVIAGVIFKDGVKIAA